MVVFCGRGAGGRGQTTRASPGVRHWDHCHRLWRSGARRGGEQVTLKVGGGAGGHEAMQMVSGWAN
jgi:hypothetical protein